MSHPAGVSGEKSVTTHMCNGNTVTTNRHEKSINTIVNNDWIDIKHIGARRNDV